MTLHSVVLSAKDMQVILRRPCGGHSTMNSRQTFRSNTKWLSNVHYLTMMEHLTQMVMKTSGHQIGMIEIHVLAKADQS